MDPHQHLAVLVGGGPAPGINSVIATATIRAVLEGVEVIGIRDGFEWIMKGDTSHITPLTNQEVSRLHFRGGSHIGISRANPTKDPKHLENAVESLLRLNVSRLITPAPSSSACPNVAWMAWRSSPRGWFSASTRNFSGACRRSNAMLTATSGSRRSISAIS
jgi:hypothetical protein